MFELQKHKRLEIAKPRDISLNRWEYILPKFCFSRENKNLVYFHKFSYYIKDCLSIENILKGVIRNEIFKKIIFNEIQLELFNNIPKIKLQVLENLHHKENKFHLLTLMNNLTEEEKEEEKIYKILQLYDYT